MNPLTITQAETDVVTLTARRALLRLLTAHPNEVIGHRRVCDELGHHVSHAAVHAASKRLGRDMAIESLHGTGGGYVHLMPVLSLGRERCCTCASHTLLGTCKRLSGRPVQPNERCWGWTHA